MMGPVRRILLLSILPFVAMSVVGSTTPASAGTTTSHPQPLCTALKSGVRAGQRILGCGGDEFADSGEIEEGPPCR
jgi:hypothetical protein